MSLGFERMTIFCRDLDASLQFYRDLIGLVAVEEKVIEGPAAGGLLQLPPCRMRIALLAPAADADVILGLFEIGGVDLDQMALPSSSIGHGQAALVLSTTAFSELQEKLTRDKIRFLTPPLRYPKRQASPRSPAGIYQEMIVYDPDGVLVSLMQIDPLPDEIAK